MNLYEIRLEDNIISNDTLLEAFLFDCQCTLFLVDGKNEKSVNSVKDIMDSIDNEKYPFMKRIIVENKSDIMPEEENEEIKKLIKSYPFLDYIRISLKTKDNFENLLIKIYEEVNLKLLENNLFPLDKVAKCTLKDYIKEDLKDLITLIIVGDSCIGKSQFSLRYLNNKFYKSFICNLGIDKDVKILKINNKDYYKLTIWNTPG